MINFFVVKDLLHTAAEASFPSCASWIPRLWCMPMKWAAGWGLLVDTACQLWAGLYMLCLVNLKPWHQEQERERERVNYYVLKRNQNYQCAEDFCLSQLWKIIQILTEDSKMTWFPHYQHMNKYHCSSNLVRLIYCTSNCMTLESACQHG